MQTKLLSLVHQTIVLKTSKFEGLKILLYFNENMLTYMVLLGKIDALINESIALVNESISGGFKNISFIQHNPTLVCSMGSRTFV